MAHQQLALQVAAEAHLAAGVGPSKIKHIGENEMSDDITVRWFKFVDKINRDPGYAQSHQADLDRTELEETWRRECPGLELPQIQWSGERSRQELTGLSRPRR
jgi:hypothetical protein